MQTYQVRKCNLQLDYGWNGSHYFLTNIIEFSFNECDYATLNSIFNSLWLVERKIEGIDFIAIMKLKINLISNKAIHKIFVIHVNNNHNQMNQLWRHAFHVIIGHTMKIGIQLTINSQSHTQLSKSIITCWMDMTQKNSSISIDV